MHVEMSEDSSEIIVCMTSRLEQLRFLEILKIPIKAEAAKMIYYRHTMDVVKKKVMDDFGMERYIASIGAYERKRKAEVEKMNAEKARVKAEEEKELRRLLALKKEKMCIAM